MRCAYCARVLMRKTEVYNGSTVTRVAIKLKAMTFVRTSELIGARWEEFDLDGGGWDIPASRMKMKTPHVVPPSTQAATLLRSLQTLAIYPQASLSTAADRVRWAHRGERSGASCVSSMTVADVRV